jgi:Phosphopantetheinyl transferase (holo-ACP synthase)
MIKGIGIDIVEVERIRQSIEKYKDRFRDKIFTEEEINYSMEFKGKDIST